MAISSLQGLSRSFQALRSSLDESNLHPFNPQTIKNLVLCSLKEMGLFSPKDPVSMDLKKKVTDLSHYTVFLEESDLSIERLTNSSMNLRLNPARKKQIQDIVTLAKIGLNASKDPETFSLLDEIEHSLDLCKSFEDALGPLKRMQQFSLKALKSRLNEVIEGIENLSDTEQNDASNSLKNSSTYQKTCLDLQNYLQSDSRAHGSQQRICAVLSEHYFYCFKTLEEISRKACHGFFGEEVRKNFLQCEASYVNQEKLIGALLITLLHKDIHKINYDHLKPSQDRSLGDVYRGLDELLFLHGPDREETNERLTARIKGVLRSSNNASCDDFVEIFLSQEGQHLSQWQNWCEAVSMLSRRVSFYQDDVETPSVGHSPREAFNAIFQTYGLSDEDVETQIVNAFIDLKVREIISPQEKKLETLKNAFLESMQKNPDEEAELGSVFFEMCCLDCFDEAVELLTHLDGQKFYGFIHEAIDIYLRRGLFDKACHIFEHLNNSDSRREVIRQLILDPDFPEDNCKLYVKFILKNFEEIKVALPDEEFLSLKTSIVTTVESFYLQSFELEDQVILAKLCLYLDQEEKIKQNLLESDDIILTNFLEEVCQSPLLSYEEALTIARLFKEDETKYTRCVNKIFYNLLQDFSKVVHFTESTRLFILKELQDNMPYLALENLYIMAPLFAIFCMKKGVDESLYRDFLQTFENLLFRESRRKSNKTEAVNKIIQQQRLLPQLLNRSHSLGEVDLEEELKELFHFYMSLGCYWEAKENGLFQEGLKHYNQLQDKELKKYILSAVRDFSIEYKDRPKL